MDEEHPLQDRGSEASMSLLKKVKRLKSKDIAQASRTLLDPAIPDPLSEYIRETPVHATHPKWYRLIERARFAVLASQWARLKWGLTINHGQAVIGVLPGPENIKKSKLDMVYIYAARAPDFIGKSEQQRKRPDEAGKTLFNLIRDAFGDDAKKMYHIAALATSPDLQGIGCDALVSAVLKVADAERRSASALAADPIHTEFFQYKGFECVAGTFIGKDEPTWDRPPVKISLMLRPYKEC